MHKKNNSIAQFSDVIAKLLFYCCISFSLKASHPEDPSYKLSAITITSTGAMEPMTIKPYPYLRLLKWLSPTTDTWLIDRKIKLIPGAIFDTKTLLSIKQRLTDLPYFSTVSVKRKVIDPTSHPMVSDLIIQTKDRFPITLALSLDEGPLLTLTHANAWGYGHNVGQQFFLKKRWGYGLSYELPEPHGNYMFGGQYYRQRGSSYTFNYQNLWIAKLFPIEDKKTTGSFYWMIGLSGYKKYFIKSPPVSRKQNRLYHNYMLVLGKVGWVADRYEGMRGVYTLHTLEQLPKGGSVAMIYGYQKGQFNNRHYIGVDCIKNIATPTLRYLYISCQSAAFINRNQLEETILKLELAYAGPSIQRCNGARQSIAINYITGYRMPKERILGIICRDPESLDPPGVDNTLHEPIYGRLNLHLASTLHMPIVLSHVRFALLVFTNFIALYNQYNRVLNQTFIDTYGIGLHLEHATRPWPGIVLKVGYNPLLGKIVPSVAFSIGQFKNKREAKPMLLAYN